MTDWNDEEMGWLRERPPMWPRREGEPDPHGDGFGTRPREPYEPGGLAEFYAGSATIEDMESEGGEENLRVLARYTVARLLSLATSGQLTGRDLRIERRVALQHLELLPAHDWERRLLEQLVGHCRDTITPPIFGPLLLAAESAVKRGQNYGAFDLYRAGYHLGVSRGWWEEAERSATGVARLARLDEARVSARLWRRRARVLAHRAQRAQEALRTQEAQRAQEESV